MKKFDSESFVKGYEGFIRNNSKFGAHYPVDYQNINVKTNLVIEYLPLLSGSRLVDLGSNFGMFSLLSAQFCKSVVGVERDSDIYLAANDNLQTLRIEGYELENVSFLNAESSVVEKLEFDAVLLTLVLYHLNDDEISILQNNIAKKCSFALVQTRPGRASQYVDGKLPDYVSNNKKYNGLINVEDNINFLKDCGFKTFKISYLKELFFGEDFPVILGLR